MFVTVASYWLFGKIKFKKKKVIMNFSAFGSPFSGFHQFSPKFESQNSICTNFNDQDSLLNRYNMHSTTSNQGKMPQLSWKSHMLIVALMAGIIDFYESYDIYYISRYISTSYFGI